MTNEARLALPSDEWLAIDIHGQISASNPWLADYLASALEQDSAQAHPDRSPADTYHRVLADIARKFRGQMLSQLALESLPAPGLFY